MSIQIGTASPLFSLPTDGSGNINLADLKGKKVVIYFYPKDDTPGCTIEAKDFRDLSEKFAAANTQIIGISRDSPTCHAKFKDKYQLTFALASDENGEVCEKYGVWKQKSMFGKKYMGIERTTYLIDETGKIQKIWPEVSVSGHAAAVLAEVTKG